VFIIKRLNIFIDESGDFGFADGSSELYAVSFTIHESNNSITKELNYLNDTLNKANYTGMIHLADLVAKRGEYSSFNLQKRKNIFWSIIYFSKRVKVKIRTVIVDKRYMNKKSQLNKELALGISSFINSMDKYIQGFEKVVVYYDEGQDSLGGIIDTLLTIRPNVERRIEFDHIEKRLFQVADMLTFIDKLDFKRKLKIPFTKSEKYFFEGKDFRHIINILKGKRI